MAHLGADVAAFVEKPETTPGLPDDPNAFLASMGNYVFDADALVEALNRDAEDEDAGRPDRSGPGR